MTAKKTKHIGIECCRIFAMLMICNLHVLGMGGILEKVDSQKDLYYIFANFLEAFSYSAVNFNYFCICYFFKIICQLK